MPPEREMNRIQLMFSGKKPSQAPKYVPQTIITDVSSSEAPITTEEIEQLKINQAKLMNALRDQELGTKRLLDEKNQRINELIMNQKAVDYDLHNLTEQLFQQAYKLVNDEKKLSADMKMRIVELEKNQTKLINELREQEMCNQKLRSYIDNIISRVIQVYPEVLEIGHESPPKAS